LALLFQNFEAEEEEEGHQEGRGEAQEEGSPPRVHHHPPHLPLTNELAMLTIWMNIIRKDRLWLFVSAAFLHAAYVGRLYGVTLSFFVLACWVFIVPAMIYLIDHNRKVQPDTKLTLRNFFSIMWE